MTDDERNKLADLRAAFERGHVEFLDFVATAAGGVVVWGLA